MQHTMREVCDIVCPGFQFVFLVFVHMRKSSRGSKMDDLGWGWGCAGGWQGWEEEESKT